MDWFLIALINPVAHAAVNHLDKYIISRYLKANSVGSLVLFSALFSAVALVVIPIIKPEVLQSTSLGIATILMLNGGLLVLGIVCYLYALFDNEASRVAPFFQLVPVFGFVLGFLILGETLTGDQSLSALLIVIGTALLSFQFSGGHFGVRKKLLFLMLGASIFYSINLVVFKSVANELTFLDCLLCDMAGKFIFGLVILATIRSYRTEFFSLIRTNRSSVLSLNGVNELLALTGEIAIVLAALYAPVAIVQAVGGLQPLFVLLIGVLLTRFFPAFGKESLKRSDIVQKLTAIGLITCGVYFLKTR